MICARFIGGPFAGMTKTLSYNKAPENLRVYTENLSCIAIIEGTTGELTREALTTLYTLHDNWPPRYKMRTQVKTPMKPSR